MPEEKKNSLDFNIPANPHAPANFISCFAAAYMFLENIGVSCENDCTWYYNLFETMSGCNSIRCRFDGELTDMQRIITGAVVDGKNSCGTEQTTGSIKGTINFLFGYTGYDYRKSADITVFRSEIAASIDAGMPVIARDTSERFYLITGYDGDALMCYDNPPAYNELDVLYIITGKIALIDNRPFLNGFGRILGVMKYGIQKNLWNEYLRKMGGWDKFPSDDGLDKADAGEIKMRLRRICDTMAYISNIRNFMAVLHERNIERFCQNDFYEELTDPKIFEWWRKIYKKCETINKALNYFAELSEKIDQIAENLSAIREISGQICETIIQIRDMDIKLYDNIKQVITKLNSKWNNNWWKNVPPGSVYKPKDKSNSKIEDFIPLNLDGDKIEAALDFIAYLHANKMPPRGGGTMNVWDVRYKGKRIGGIGLHWSKHNPSWGVTLRLDRINDYQETVLNEGLQNIIWDNVRYCGFCSYHCHTGDAVILGKTFRNLCYGNGTMFNISDPDAVTINGIKRLLELEKMARH